MMKTLPLLLLSLTAHSQAALLLNEDFSSYTAGSINGQPTTSPNASGNWEGSNDGRYGIYTVGSGVLTMDRSNTSGGAAPKFAGFDIANNAATTTAYTEFWASGVLSTGSLRGGFFSTRLQTGTYGVGDTVDHLNFGIDNGNAFLANRSDTFDNATASLSNLYKVGVSSASFDGGEHSLLVQLLNVDDTNDIYRLWVDADTSGGFAGLGTPDVEITTGNMISDTGATLYLAGNAVKTRFVGITANSASAQSGSFSDYRLGTTFTDVVPEPSSALLSLVGMSGLLCLRRRG